MCKPRYRDLRHTEIPTASADGGKVEIKVISGRSQGVDSVQELAYTPVWLLDVRMRAGAMLKQALPIGWNAFAYMLQGAAAFGVAADAKTVPRYHNVVFEQKGDTVDVSVAEDAEEDARFSKWLHMHVLVLELPTRVTFSFGADVVRRQSSLRVCRSTRRSCSMDLLSSTRKRRSTKPFPISKATRMASSAPRAGAARLQRRWRTEMLMYLSLISHNRSA